MRVLGGFLVALGVLGLVLVLTGDLQVDLDVRVGKPVPTPTVSRSIVVLHANDNGKTVKVKVGQVVAVDLGAGYGIPYSSNPQVLAPTPIAGAKTPKGTIQGGASSFYCGALPTPKAGSGICAPVCPSGPNVRCAAPCYSNAGGSTSTYCQICPCGTACPVPLPIIVPPATAAPTIGEPAGGTGSLDCQPYCYCQIACPAPMAPSDNSPSNPVNVPCSPCGCGIYCAQPATGGSGSTGGGSGSTGTTPASAQPASNGTSVYCWPPCACQSYCVMPMNGMPKTNQGGSWGSANSGSGIGPGGTCGHGRWRAAAVGTADIIANQDGCDGGALCTPYAMPMLREFVVHIVVGE
jgi:hypothetical protein